MRSAERSMVVFGAYLALVGVALVLAPNAVLALLGLAPSGEAWIRVAGALAVALAVYFVDAGRSASRSFMRASVVVRCGFAATLVAFALLGLAAPLIALFALTDLAGAAWTAAALRGAAPRR